MTTPEPTAAEERARIVAWLDGEIETMRDTLSGLTEFDERWPVRALIKQTEIVRDDIEIGQHWEKGE